MNRKGDMKAVEELQEVTIGISEHGASLLALLETLQHQSAAATPALNVAPFSRLTKKPAEKEHALQILDLKRDLPRSDTDVSAALTAWFALGAELAKEHFAAVSKLIPALTNSTYVLMPFGVCFRGVPCGHREQRHRPQGASCGCIGSLEDETHGPRCN